MKKYIIYSLLLIINCWFIWINYDVIEVIYIKYIFAPTIREYLAFMFYQMNNIVFVYLNIMDYLSIKKETELRIGKKGFSIMIFKRCIMTFLIIFFTNVLIDYLVFDINSLIYCILDVLFLIVVIFMTNAILGKKDFQTIFSVFVVCILRNICLCILLL